MISFLRRIRQNLITRNRVSKYFFYAIGEIILVVLGILMALGINNWNEDKKNRNFESEILTLILKNLVQDSTAIIKELKQSIKAQKATAILLEEISKENYNDSLKYLMGDIINFQRFKSQTSGFEVLKAKGKDNVKNSELQLALITYYDNTLFQIYESNLDVEKSFNADWVPEIKRAFSDFNWKEYATPTNMEEYLQKPSTIVLFKLFKNNRQGQRERMEMTLEKITEVQRLIKQEIK